jgi:hypothetical protein
MVLLGRGAWTAGLLQMHCDYQQRRENPHYPYENEQAVVPEFPADF